MTQSNPHIDLLSGPEDRAPWWGRPALWGCGAALAAGAAIYVVWTNQRAHAALPHYVTQAVSRGNLVVAVSANGTLVPTTKVDIGSELSGTVARVLVDVNDAVKKGQLLAELDTDKLRGQVMRSRAALELYEAKARLAAATVREATGNLQRLREVSRLSDGRVPSQSEMATGEATLARAQADESGARAGIADARAGLGVDETNLRKASIRSPINGVVLSRSVDPGNAVAASLQAVTLFTIAEDLARMKLQVNVDEADVGQVRAGQKAAFTVSAYPSRYYPAVATRVYYGSTTTNNVVTYLAELKVDNQDLTLRPGMTATARIVTADRNGVLLVPNSALRFRPSFVDAAPADGVGPSGALVSRLLPRMPAPVARTAVTAVGANREVWVLQEGKAIPVSVTPGASDGRMTEVRSDTLQPGQRVITEQAGEAGK